jgi:DNA-directed RNA polymerase specialized sigma24 family protein
VDSEQTRQLFQTHWTSGVRLAALLGAADPEDAAAESFSRLYAQRQSIQADRAASYLRRILINYLRDQHRRAARLARKTPVLALLPPSETTPDPTLTDAIRALPRRQREAVILRLWLDLDERQTAEAMSVSPGSVKTHLRRALAQLSTSLKDGYVGH